MNLKRIVSYRIFGIPLWLLIITDAWIPVVAAKLIHIAWKRRVRARATT